MNRVRRRLRRFVRTRLAPLKSFVRAQVWLYKISGGRRGGTMDGERVILLTTTGRKSGHRRTVPVVPLIEGDDVFVVASMGGAPRHPAWYLNLSAKPDVDVQIGPERWHARAVVMPEGEERDRVWKRLVERMPVFAEYEKKTTRVIPIVQLVRES